MEVDVFGVSVHTSAVIIALYSVLAAATLGVNDTAIVVSTVLSIGTIMLIGHHGLEYITFPVQAALYLAALILLLSPVVVLSIFAARRFKNRRISPSPVRNLRAAFAPSSQPGPQTTALRKLYHGTTRENALEIHKTGMWLVGEPTPRGVYITNKFDVAKQYSGNSGAILVIRADSKVRLTDLGNGIYVYEVPDAVPFEWYYKIEGLKLVDILDAKGNPIT
jgi:hypothetical protein